MVIAVDKVKYIVMFLVSFFAAQFYGLVACSDDCATTQTPATAFSTREHTPEKSVYYTIIKL